MKTARAWRLRAKDFLITSGPRQRPHLKRPIWVIVLIGLVSIFLIGAYIYPPRSSAACYIFSSKGCTVDKQLPPVISRDLTDQETASRVVIKEILKTPSVSKNPKIAFMFLTPGPLPFEKLWDMFFQGHEDRFTVYVHASREKPAHVSRYFVGRDIHSEKVVWGKISMVDAERRLLASALKDPDNQQFVLLSDSCVPVHNFDFVYNYLIFTNISFVDCFVDPGPHGNGRYSEHMLPEVEGKDFRKGSQWFTMKRQHAIIVMADSLYYTKFRLYCKPNMEGRNCYADEHYFPSFFHMMDPGGIANWSVTFVDWSEGKWHPRAFRAQDITYDLLKNITSYDVSPHFTSDEKNRETYGLIPVTVKQISEASHSGDDKSNFLIDGVDVTNVTVVGMVFNKTERVTDVAFNLDDGTGRIKCNRWVNEGFDSKEMEDIQDGTYVRLNGRLKSTQGKKQLVAFSVRPVTNFDEITFHFLECIHFHLYNSRKQLQGDVSTQPQKGNTLPGAPAQNMSNGHLTAPANQLSGQFSVDGLKGFDQMVLDYLRQPVNFEQEKGIHRDGISQHLKIPLEKILESIRILEEEGLIYSTIDEYHYKATTGG